MRWLGFLAVLIVAVLAAIAGTMMLAARKAAGAVAPEVPEGADPAGTLGIGEPGAVPAGTGPNRKLGILGSIRLPGLLPGQRPGGQSRPATGGATGGSAPATASGDGRTVRSILTDAFESAARRTIDDLAKDASRALA